MSPLLIYVQGNEFDKELLDIAFNNLNPNEDVIHLIYVIEMDRTLPIDSEIPPLTAKGENTLKNLEFLAKRLKFNVEGHLVQSRDIGSAIIQESFEKNINTIIIELQKNEINDYYPLNKMAEYLLINSKCQVILVKPRSA
ncbi:MAG: hypothetical protein CL766_06795 [Chloroflexi bacterium]|nr:hypothetical protein [Chloroflexota bacterium]